MDVVRREYRSSQAAGWILLWVIVGLGLFSLTCRAAAVVPGQQLARAAEASGIHQFIQASPRIYSGSQPESDASFAYLASLGIKTILSVDGTKPDIETARRHGIRYVHLPYGYDGVPTNRVAELVKLGQVTEGRVFVHCHHGKHRGPAAVALLCRSTEGWTSQQATQFMVRAGTSREYPGLFNAAETFTAPTAAQLSQIGSLPETSPTPKQVEIMVDMDQRYDRIQSSVRKILEKETKNAPIGPEEWEAAVTESTLLWEQLHEHLRAVRSEKGADSQRGADYLRMLERAEQAAKQLKLTLDAPGADRSKLNAGAMVQPRLAAVTQSCTECHRAFRNRKPLEPSQ